ncbi:MULTISPECIES: excisionase family DNA-binding protein [Oceanobacillus]|uniref:Helix-turn-helix domain-containing protein n=1 Tax=Oceanobacillus neutriphilus TaxID=531815 RepID=A0ABQ2P2U3_9BACI|nr:MULTISPECIES: excisionase family DNA-binding protein [Oceanobacillus]MCT1904697.1 excisionase family DNA-binding protein [Oceanobacillus sojae]GGP16555.1 hypothetical protein GCM10011346_48990 [Oceanobacillus neutriphilus]
MYLTIKETAAYLSIDESIVRAYVLQGKIRTIYDGENYLINRNQFTTYFEQVEKYRKLVQAYLDEPIPEDIDVKDED